jgi:broad specificity phosphatase PhoE
MQVKGNTVLIIRHSERPEIKTLLNESEIEITPEGRDAAIKLGEEIAKGHKNTCFQVFSWGSLRVVQTAQAIAEGLSNNDDNRLDPIVARF